MSNELTYVCDASAVADGSVIAAQPEGLDLAVYNLEGEYFVTANLCTHGPGILSDGDIEDGLIECDFHGGQFDIRSGEAVTAPCMIPLKTYPVKVIDGKVYIRQ